MEFAEPSPSQSDVLSQAEVERLLAQVAEEESSSMAAKPLAGIGSSSRIAEAVEPYDFRQPSHLSAGDLRKLRLRHEGFIQALAARMSIYLRLEFGLQLTKLQTVSYQKFTEGLPSPTHLTLFKADPLRGVCLLDIPPRLGLTIVDRLLGGQAHSVNAERDLSEIESALLDQAIHVIIGEWSSHWSAEQELRPALLGHENNARFLQTAPADTVMLALSMEARIGDCLEQIQIGIPYYTIEPLLARMSSLSEKAETGEPAKPKISLKWNAELNDVKVPVVAEWHGLEVTARQLAMMQAGDVLPLSQNFASEIVVRLDRLPKFKGRLGTRAGCWAIEVTQILKS